MNAPESRFTFLQSSYVRVTLALVLILVSYVLLFAYFTDSYAGRMYEFRKQELYRLVELGLNTLEPIRQQQRQGDLTPEEARAQGIDLVRRMTYTYGLGDNYLFMSDYQGRMLVQPFEPDKEGTEQWNLQDVDGRYIIRELVAVARGPEGQGYVEYTYPPPGSDRPQLKFSFVAGIPEWESYIGTGMYVGDVQAQNTAYLRDSLLLTGGLALLIFGLAAVALRPTVSSYRLLLRLFDRIRRQPDEVPEVPLDQFRPGSEGWQLLAGFQSMIEQISQGRRQLKESQERLALVLRATNDGIWDWDMETDEVYYSPRWKRMLGYAEDEIEHRYTSWRSLVHPDDLEKALDDLDVYLKGNKSFFASEHRMRHKDGSYRWILTRGIAVQDAQGKPYRMVGSHADITQRKQSEKALENQLAFEEMITTLSNSFINLPPQKIDDGIRNALQTIGEFTGMDHGYVFMLSSDKVVMECTHEWRREGTAPAGSRLQEATVDAFPWASRILVQRDVIYVPSVADLPQDAKAEKQQWQSRGVRSLVAVPMVYQEEIQGFLGFSARRGEKPWLQENVQLLKIVGEIIVNALEHKRSQAIQAGQQQFLELLATGGEFSDTLHALVRLIEGQWPGMLGLILLLDENGRHLHIGASVSLPEDYVQSIEGLEIGPMVGSCGTASYRAERVIVEDIVTDPRWDSLRDLAVAYGLRACWSEPVISAEGKVVGTFAMYYRHPRSPTEAELHTIEMAAHLVGVAIEHKQTREAVQAAYHTLEQRVVERTREIERRRQVAEGLRDILAVLNSNRPLSAILDYTIRQATRLLGAQAGLLFRLEDDGQQAIFDASCDLPPEIAAIQAASVDNSSGNQELLEQRPVRIVDFPAYVEATLSDPDAGLTELDRQWYSLLAQHYQSALAVPLILKNELYGGLLFYYQERRALSGEDDQLGLSLADQTALAIGNARLQEQVEQTAVAAERSRLAHDLHDAVTQTLFSASLIAEVLPRLWTRNQAEAERRLEELRQLTRGALAEMRTLLLELRPSVLVETELSELLKQLAEAFQGRARVPVELALAGQCELPSEVKVALYRIAQESLNNVAKHAEAQQVEMRLTCQQDSVELQVRDDGQGFDPSRIPPSHLGVGIMRERAETSGAQLRIDSRPGHGTCITVLWHDESAGKVKRKEGTGN
jgi:PAS domain S-box-containing protein